MKQSFLSKLHFLKTNSLTTLLAIVDTRTPKKSRILFIAAILYLFMPIDIISDIFPGVGLIDDTLICSGLIYLANKSLPIDIKIKYQPVASTIEKKTIVILIIAIIVCISVTTMVAYFMFNHLFK